MKSLKMEVGCCYILIKHVTIKFINQKEMVMFLEMLTEALCVSVDPYVRYAKCFFYLFMLESGYSCFFQFAVLTRLPKSFLEGQPAVLFIKELVFKFGISVFVL